MMKPNQQIELTILGAHNETEGVAYKPFKTEVVPCQTVQVQIEQAEGKPKKEKRIKVVREVRNSLINASASFTYLFYPESGRLDHDNSDGGNLGGHNSLQVDPSTMEEIEEGK